MSKSQILYNVIEPSLWNAFRNDCINDIKEFLGIQVLIHKSW